MTASLLAVLAVTPGCATTDDPGAIPSSTLEATEVADPADAVTNGLDVASPEDALAQARTALVEAPSYRVIGAPTEGEPLDLVFVNGTPPAAEDSPALTTDAPEVEPPARGSFGTISQDGSTFSLRAVDGAAYVRGDLDWLADAVADSAERTLGGKWLLLPDSLAQDLETFTDPQSFADAVLDPSGSVRSVGVAVIEGIPAVGVRFDDTEATAWVSGVGTPYPLLVERLGATADEGVLRFTDVGEPVTLRAPKSRNVVVAPETSGG
jgi:hypothetical protein